MSYRTMPTMPEEIIADRNRREARAIAAYKAANGRPKALRALAAHGFRESIHGDGIEDYWTTPAAYGVVLSP